MDFGEGEEAPEGETGETENDSDSAGWDDLEAQHGDQVEKSIGRKDVVRIIV